MRNGLRIGQLFGINIYLDWSWLLILLLVTMWVKIVGKIKLALAAHITPVEVEDRTPFEDDTHHAAYDADYVWRFWQALLQANRLLSEFRSWFLGKASPVHFFWGAFDLAVTRFFLWQPLRKKSISIRRKDG